MDVNKDDKTSGTHSSFAGYYSNTVPAHDPLLTETGAGTTCGEYMRRFCHPICLSLELTDTPRYVKLLSEELVVFRDKSGRVGVLHAHYCHRGASLEYVQIQEKGIMCSYHGWKFDIDGRCLEIPSPKGEEEGMRFACTRWQGAYKAFERSGLVFTYMGPPEEEPPFPDFEDGFTVGQDDELVAFSNFQHCNWLQVRTIPQTSTTTSRFIPRPWCRVMNREQLLAKPARRLIWSARICSSSRSMMEKPWPGRRRAGSTRASCSSVSTNSFCLISAFTPICSRPVRSGSCLAACT